jgi:hypothetical protein
MSPGVTRQPAERSHRSPTGTKINPAPQQGITPLVADFINGIGQSEKSSL